MELVKKYSTDPVSKNICSKFIDFGTTYNGHATTENKQKELEETLNIILNELPQKRDLFLALTCLPGVTYHVIKKTVEKFLTTKQPIVDHFETSVLTELMRSTGIVTVLKLLRDMGHNNSRVKRIGLEIIFNARDLDHNAVYYKGLNKMAFIHIWGIKGSHKIKKLLAAGNIKDEYIERYVNRYVYDKSRLNEVYQYIMFCLGEHKNITMKLMKTFIEAKKDPDNLKYLPPDVAESLRLQYHKNYSKDLLNSQTYNNQGEKAKMRKSQKANEKGVEVTFDPWKIDPISIAVHCYKTGDFQYAGVISAKAKKMSEKFPDWLKFDKVGFIFDDSYTSKGPSTEFMRPASTYIVLREIFKSLSNEFNTNTSTFFPKCKNGTNLADPFITCLENNCDLIVIASDGYENEKEGRVDELINIAKAIGVTPNVLQLTSVASAEHFGTRRLSQHIQSLPMSRVEGLPTTIIKNLIDSDFSKVLGLIATAPKKLLEVKK